MLHIILFRPEIPSNTGNIGRLCAFTGARLHLIKPLGFKLTQKELMRAGMDYWDTLDVHIHDNFEAFQASDKRPSGNLWLLTTHATANIWSAKFADNDGLIFGSEGHGAPDWLHEHVGDRRIIIPSFGSPEARCLNLSTSAGIATYEALRQIKG